MTSRVIETTTLGSVAEVAAGQAAPQDPDAFSEEGLPFLRAGSLERLVAGLPETAFERIGASKAREYGLRLFPKDTIIFAKSGMSATLGRVHRLSTPAYLVSHLAGIVPGDEIEPGYLQRWFQFRPPAELIPNQAYPSIRLSEIATLQLPLPDPDDQKRIAGILDKADGVRRKRRDAIKLADDLLRATFLEMFGDPVTNPKSWAVGDIGEAVSEINYGTAAKANEDGRGTPIVRMNNVTYEGEIDLADLKWVELGADESDKFTVRRGDLLFNRTNSPDLVGKTAVWNRDERYALAGYLVRVRFNPKRGRADFVSAYLNSGYGKHLVKTRAKPSINMSNLSASEFKRIPIYWPPAALQAEFAAVVEGINAVKDSCRLALKQDDGLFHALMQRAFTGRL